MNKVLMTLGLTTLGLLMSCSKKHPATEPEQEQVQNPVTPPKTEEPPKPEEPKLPDPPLRWTEHWFEHNQNIRRVFFDNEIVVYHDDDVQPIVWPNTFIRKVWIYTKAKYGTFGSDPRLYAIFHAGKYSGGHPSTYMDASHDYRNVIDCGSSSYTAWMSGTGNDLDIVTHEIGHIVEGAFNGIKRSPASPIWHDSKWMEIFLYDVYQGVGMISDANRWYNSMQSVKDNYPRANTQWFKNWFYPIYNNYGKTKVLTEFFTLLSKHFPQRPYNNGKQTYKEYTRDLNFGEFIHFWSGAAKTDLKDLALAAFGEKDEKGQDWNVQLQKAKADFPNIVY